MNIIVFDSGIKQPEDKCILLKDIIGTDGVGGIRSHGNIIEQSNKSQCITASYYKGIDNHGQRTLIITGGRITVRNPDNTKSRKAGLPTVQMLEIKEDGKANCLSMVGKDSVCVQIGTADINGNESIKRVYSTQGKSPTLTAICGGNQEPKISDDEITWRKLMPVECERLQTFPDNWTACVSNSRRYHALGNSWTVDVVAHIFRHVQKIIDKHEEH